MGGILSRIRRAFGAEQHQEVSSAPIDFNDLPHVEGRYTLHISGEQFEGRQAVIRTLRIGQSLRLRREPLNEYDENAVAVETLSGSMIGYVPRKNAEWVAEILDDGTPLAASVACLFCDDDEGERLDVQIHIDGVPPRGEARIWV